MKKTFWIIVLTGFIMCLTGCCEAMPILMYNEASAHIIDTYERTTLIAVALAVHGFGCFLWGMPKLAFFSFLPLIIIA